MLETKIINAFNRPSQLEKIEIVNFLHEHLQEYGDIKKDI